MDKRDFNIVASTEKEQSLLLDKLVRFNRLSLGLDPDKSTGFPLNFVMKEGKEIIAGINCSISLNVLHIKILLVDERFRGQKLGSKLLRRVEQKARAKGALIAHLDTFEFQAKDFYIKNGYEVFGVLEDCPKGHQRYYLKKHL